MEEVEGGIRTSVNLARGRACGTIPECPTLCTVSEVRIERVKGAVRRAYLPAEHQPVIFGVHSAVAEHYKVPPGSLEPHATTLDYIVAATAG